MQFIPTAIADVLLIQPKIWPDERGYFFESYRHDLFCQQVADIAWSQDNESYSTFATLRGLHYQRFPYAQNKLIQVVQGRILDVCVDLRPHSETYMQHLAVELTAERKQRLFVPAGFAHGFVVLSADAIVQYKVDQPYMPEAEAGIAHDDSQLAIDWRLPSTQLRLSEKDRQLPSLACALAELN